jgi:hypothetical protein
MLFQLHHFDDTPTTHARLTGPTIMAELKLWCCIERDPDYFQVSVPPSQTIYKLKKRIHNEADDLQCTARELTLTKVLSGYITVFMRTLI